MPFAFVTGIHGGIGVHICAVLKEKGYMLIGVDKVEGEKRTDHQYAFDIRHLHDDPKSIDPIMCEIDDITGGRLDLLVNNAATQIVKPVAEMEVADWDVTLETNLVAPFMLIKKFLPALKKARGSIVNVSSIHANSTKPGFVAYATSKGALVSMTRAMAVDFGSMGVRVNSILPAATDTPMLRAGFEGNGEGFERLGAMHPIGRIASPVEVAEVIAFLGSKEASYITGSCIQIDGGIGGRLHDPA